MGFFSRPKTSKWLVRLFGLRIALTVTSDQFEFRGPNRVLAIRPFLFARAVFVRPVVSVSLQTTAVSSEEIQTALVSAGAGIITVAGPYQIAGIYLSSAGDSDMENGDRS